jgi:phenylalanyl-tRNA synthetase beta chain
MFLLFNNGRGFLFYEILSNFVGNKKTTPQMKVSYNWLKQYLNINLNPNELGAILTDTGLEVEGIEKIESIKGGLEGVLVGEVITCEKHPDADKLKVTTVNIGKEELLQIVCGAPNVAAGQKVIVATVGCTLFPTPEEPFKIKLSKIRGVESQGMLCAEDELGLGKSHAGILVLDPSIEVGTKAANYFDVENDYQIEIGLTPNRADALGCVGVCRDIKAYLNVHRNKGLTINWPTVDSFPKSNNDLKISISNENEVACPRYMGTSLSGVKIKPSPGWLQKRLRSVGVAPINNVVDVTNFVMRELGTPLHAYDASTLKGSIVIKNAKQGDNFVTLDGVKRKLRSDDLMISNGSDNLCIAGVYGGVKSGVKNSTTQIFLESAYFDPISVRKTAKYHGLNTDSSFRFERGVDPELTEFALKRAALLIQEIAGGEISMDILDIYPKKIENKTVVFHYAACTQLIGFELPKEQINEILENLDIKIHSDINGTAKLEIPAYRVDVTREVDVMEEILRIFGYNNVPMPTKLNASITHFKKPDFEKVQSVISEFLVGKGCVELLNNSLTSSQYCQKLGETVISEKNEVRLLNPLSQDLDVMRQTLLFNTLEVVQHNQNRQNPDLKLFEFGKVYRRIDSKFEENKRLLLTMTGRIQKEQWNSTAEPVSFYTLKGTSLSLFNRLGLGHLVSESNLQNSLLQDGVELFILKEKVGEIGWISAQHKKHFGLKNDVFVADLDWDAILRSLDLVRIKFAELPKTFAVRRDFSLLLNSNTKFSEIAALAKTCDKKILQQVGLFDVYEGNSLKEGKKSYAVSFLFQDNEQTLKDAQVDAVMEKIRAELETKLDAQLR